VITRPYCLQLEIKEKYRGKENDEEVFILLFFSFLFFAVGRCGMFYDFS
jgi:hypothetical protein